MPSFEVINEDGNCRVRHGDVVRRLESLEEWRQEVDRTRLEDFKDLTTKLGAIHEKLNSVALQVAQLAGRDSGKDRSASFIVALLGLGVAAAAIIWRR